jgi:hypothetical protein
LDEVRLELQLIRNSTRAYRIKLDAWGFRKNNRPYEKASQRPTTDEARSRAHERRWSLSSEDTLLTSPNDDDNIPRFEITCETDGLSWPLYANSCRPRPINANINDTNASQENLGNKLVYSEPIQNGEDRAASSLLDLSRARPLERVLAPQIDERDSQGFTQLHRAVITQNVSEVERLLAVGAAVDVGDWIRRQPLHHAVSQNPSRDTLFIAKLLLRHSASPIAKDELDLTPVHLAAGYPQMLEHILDCLKVEFSFPISVDPLDCHGNSPLLHLLNSAVRPATSYHPIRRTTDQDLQQSIWLLLEAGADVGIRNKVGWSAFNLALQLQQKFPNDDKLHLDLFVKKCSGVLDAAPGQETPFSVFLNAVNWYAEPEIVERWVDIAELFLEKGADPSTKIDGRPLLTFCVLCLKFLKEESLRRMTAMLQLVGTLCKLVRVTDELGFTILEQVIWNLPFDVKGLNPITAQCLEALVRQYIDQSADHGWPPKALPLSVLLQRLSICRSIQGIEIVELVQILLDAGADPLAAPLLRDRSIYKALRYFRGENRDHLICLLLDHLIKTNTSPGESSHTEDAKLPDYHWFWNWTLSCRDKRWRLAYEDKRLPRDLAPDEELVLRRTARRILANICIKEAKSIFFDSKTSEFDRTWAREQILFIVQDPRYQELTNNPPWHMKCLIEVLVHEEPQPAATEARNQPKPGEHVNENCVGEVGRLSADLLAVADFDWEAWDEALKDGSPMLTEIRRKAFPKPKDVLPHAPKQLGGSNYIFANATPSDYRLWHRYTFD